MGVSFQQFNFSDLRFSLTKTKIIFIFRLANGTAGSQWEAAV